MLFYVTMELDEDGIYIMLEIVQLGSVSWKCCL